jgi:hypothetical protein
MTQWQDILAGLFYLRLSGRRGPFNPADYIGLASQAAFHVFSISSLAGSTSTMLLVHAALLVLLVVGMAGKYIRWWPLQAYDPVEGVFRGSDSVYAGACGKKETRSKAKLRGVRCCWRLVRM